MRGHDMYRSPNASVCRCGTVMSEGVKGDEIGLELHRRNLSLKT